MKTQSDQWFWRGRGGSGNPRSLDILDLTSLFHEYFCSLAEILEEWEKVKRKIKEY